MKDWKSIAQAVFPELPPRELERLLPPLIALEQAFRPLAQGLTPDVEPAAGFSVEAKAE